ncbi:MAG TPA: branched-chain amino acid ABC transporter permease [Mesorhizobium sp.]|jgi:branched-chain amino acid transport system permease protein
MDSAQLVQFAISGLTVGAIYALVGLGFNLIFNATDVINFAQGEFVMLGGVLACIAIGEWHWPLWLAIIATVAAVGALGALIDFGAVSRVRNGSVMTIVMITLGVSVVLKTATLLWVGPNPLYFDPFTAGPPLRVFGAVVQLQALWVIGIGGLAMAGLGIFFSRSALGREMLACAIDREAASLMGIDVRKMVRISFILSGALGALAGVLITPLTNATYDQGFTLALKGFAASALGGFGRSSSAIVGGLALGLIEAASVAVLPSGWKDSVALIVLILVLMIKPSGLLGGRAERRHTQAM